eukprot:s1033_g5.t1
MRGFGASRPPKPPAPVQRLSSPGSSPALQLRGRNLAQAKCGGPISEDTHGAWSPHTVEIQAEDGEVFALRPCGEVLALPKDTARQALPSLQEVLLEREMKTVKTVKPPDAAGRQTTESTKTTETKGKELLSDPSPGRPRKPARPAASAAATGSTDAAAIPEALAAAVAQLVDAANVVAAAARKTDKTEPLNGDTERPKSPSKPPLRGPKAAASPKGPLSKGAEGSSLREAEPRLARRSQSAAPAAPRGGAIRAPCRVKSSSESPGARARNSLMSKYADLDHVLVLPPEAMQWSKGRFEELRLMSASILRHAPRLCPPDAELILKVLSAPVHDGLQHLAESLVDERPDWFVVLLAGPFFENTKDMFGEGFPIFAEVKTPTELISVFARNCSQDESAPVAQHRVHHLQLEGHSIQVQHCRPRSWSCSLSAALKEGLAAPHSTPSGSAASATYFALARQMKFQVPLFVFWCEDAALATASGSSVDARAPERFTCSISSSLVDVFLFHLPAPAECRPGSLILAPTGSGKSTWRSLAPIYCPEGEVMEDVTFHPSYHKSIRLSSGAWLSSAATDIFLRDLALLMRWLRSRAGGSGGAGKKISFNCSGEVLMKAVELEILRPEDVVLVLVPESVHRRNLASRRASDAAEAKAEENESPAKKFKRDASLSEFEAGAKTNRETLLAAAQKCGVPATCRNPLLGRPPVGDPSQLTECYDVTMACGRRIHGWLHKDAPVGAQPTVWQISASVLKGAEAENAYVLKTLSGSILLTDGRTLISAEDPYRETSEIFWTRVAGKTDSEFLLASQSLGRGACARDRLVPNESEKAAAILWYPGSFAPFHVGHLNCLRAAKKELSEHLHLAGAYVQPQPFGHLAYKKLDDKSALLAADVVRLTMLEHLISKEDWVMVEPQMARSPSSPSRETWTLQLWEVLVLPPRKGSNLEHLNALRRNLQAAREHIAGSRAGELVKSLEIVWVMGDDAFPGFREKFLDPNSWHSKQMAQVLQEGRFRLCLEVDADAEFSGDFSATALRNAWLKGAGASELSKFLGSQEAARYLCSLRVMSGKKGSRLKSMSLDDKSPAMSSESSFKDDLHEVLANALSPQRTIRIEAMGSSGSQADGAPASMPNDASCDSLATRLAQLSPQQRLALQELLEVAEKVPSRTAKLRELFETTGWPGQSGAVYVFMRPGAAKLDAFLAMLAAAAAYPEDDPGDAANLALECRERKCRSMSFFLSSTLKHLPAAVLVNRRFLVANSSDVIKTKCGHFEESFRPLEEHWCISQSLVKCRLEVQTFADVGPQDPDEEEKKKERGDAASVWVSWLRRNRLHQMIRYDGNNLRLDGVMHRPALSKGESFRARAQKTGEVRQCPRLRSGSAYCDLAVAAECWRDVMSVEVQVSGVAGHLCHLSLVRQGAGPRVSEIKKDISEVLKVPVEQQRLLHGDAELQDGHVLSRSSTELTLIKRPAEQARWRWQMQQGMVEKLKVETVEKLLKGCSLEFAASNLRADPELVLAAVENDWRALQFAATSLRDNERIVLAAVQQDGAWDWTALQFASPSARGKHDIALAAMGQAWGAILFIDHKLRKDRTFLLSALNAGFCKLEFAAASLRSDKEPILEIRNHSGQACGTCMKYI